MAAQTVSSRPASEADLDKAVCVADPGGNMATKDRGETLAQSAHSCHATLGCLAYIHPAPFPG